MISFAICSIYVIYFFYYFYGKTKDVLNPFGIALLSFTFVFGLSQLKLNNLQSSTNIKTYFIVILVTITITICGWITTKNNNICLDNKNIEIKISEKFKIIYRSLAIIASVCIFFTFLESISTGETILYNSLDIDKKNGLNFSSSYRLIRYLAEYILYCAVFAIYVLLFDLQKTKGSIVFDIFIIIIALLYAAFLQLSRGSMLFIFLSSLYLYNYKKKLSLIKVGIVIFVAIIILMLIFMFRVSSNSTVYQGKFRFQGFNSIYNYLVMGFENLNLLLSKRDGYTIFRGVHVSLAKLFPNPPYKIYPDYSVSLYNAKPFIYYFYQDLGTVGVILYTLLIFTLVGYVYSHLQTKVSEILLLYAIFQKAIFTLFFGNYFFGILSVTNGYYLTIIILLVSNRNISDSSGITNERSR